MEIQVNLTNNHDTNMFLRNLWAILGNDIHRAWQLLPRKDKQTRIIHFGQFSCNLLNAVYWISARYETKGSIKSIIFEGATGEEVLEKDKALIAESVSKALNFVENIQEKWYTFSVKSIGLGLNQYNENMFSIESCARSDDDTIKMRISACFHGFDEVDFQTIIRGKRVEVVDFLSTVVESALFNCDTSNSEMDTSTYNEYVDHNWMDDTPIKYDKLVMPKKAKDFLNNYLDDRVSNQMDIYLSASRLFHTALKYYTFVYFYDRLPTLKFVQYDASPEEIANTLFMSSLEVLSNLLEFEERSCSECGQKVFSIRKRVIELCDKYSDGFLPKRIIDTFYRDRSSYVHAGVMYSDMSYAGYLSPTISNSGDIVSQIPLVNLVSLKESVAYVFRAVLNDLEITT